LTYIELIPQVELKAIETQLEDRARLHGGRNTAFLLPQNYMISTTFDRPVATIPDAELHLNMIVGHM